MYYILNFNISRYLQNNKYPFVNDIRVSSCHGILTVNMEAAYIRDLNSRNSVFVNGKRIESNREYELHDKDVIRVGETELILLIKSDKEEE